MKILTKYAIQPKNPSLAPTDLRPTISAPQRPAHHKMRLKHDVFTDLISNRTDEHLRSI
jgi:hypothetical protein